MSPTITLNALEWVMVDADNKVVMTPCCNAAWMNPSALGMHAMCAKCGKDYALEDLDIVEAVR